MKKSCFNLIIINVAFIHGCYRCYLQEDTELEASKYSISVSVISPKKVGDGVGAYMVYKVVTKVCRLKLTFAVHF